MGWSADDRRGTAPKPILAPQLAPPHLSAPPSFYVPLKTIEDNSDIYFWIFYLWNSS